MSEQEPKTPVSLIGLVRIRDHCTFTWRRVEGSNERSVQVRSDHCLQCLHEARKQGYKLLGSDGRVYPG